MIEACSAGSSQSRSERMLSLREFRTELGAFRVGLQGCRAAPSRLRHRACSRDSGRNSIGLLRSESSSAGTAAGEKERTTMSHPAGRGPARPGPTMAGRRIPLPGKGCPEPSARTWDAPIGGHSGQLCIAEDQGVLVGSSAFSREDPWALSTGASWRKSSTVAAYRRTWHFSANCGRSRAQGRLEGQPFTDGVQQVFVGGGQTFHGEFMDIQEGADAGRVGLGGPGQPGQDLPAETFAGPLQQLTFVQSLTVRGEGKVLGVDHGLGEDRPRGRRDSQRSLTNRRSA